MGAEQDGNAPPDVAEPRTRKRDGTTVWVSLDTRSKLRMLERSGEDSNDVVTRLLDLHFGRANVGSLGRDVVERVLRLGQVGDTLDSVVTMLFTHYVNCMSRHARSRDPDGGSGRRRKADE